MLLRIIEAMMLLGAVLALLVVTKYQQDPAATLYIVMLTLDEITLFITHAIITKSKES